MKKLGVMLVFLLHCLLFVRAYQRERKHIPIKKVRLDNKWHVVVENKAPVDPLQVGMMNILAATNDSDPFVDLNDARERTQSWLVAMNNLSPAALSTLKTELDKRVNSAIEKSKAFLKLYIADTL